jgi:hypothetical protein
LNIFFSIRVGDYEYDMNVVSEIFLMEIFGVAKIGLPEPGVSRRGQIFLGSQIFEKLS